MTWEKLKSACESCDKCPLHQTKTNTVFGVGNTASPLLFVGEAPGEQEDLSGEPFVGKAGKLFDLYLEAVGIPREEIYIANILKCRPPKNRDPEESEQAACYPYLKEQIRLLRPKLIVCLGRVAAMKLIREDYRITKEHGIWLQKGEFSLTAVYHPSLLLRDIGKREEMLTDMLEVAKRYHEIRK